jgi:DNA-binding NarL/FixJ family response regulator
MLVDDHALFRTGVRRLLAGVAEYDVVGEADSAATAIEMLDCAAPEVVLMDIAMPGMDGIAASREVLRRAPDVRLLILTAHDQIADVVSAFAAGASGYALKDDRPEELFEAVRSVAGGRRYVASSLVSRLERLEENQPQLNDVLSILSPREREVFELAANCVLTRDIALKLGIARKTADTHLNRINRKLELRSMAELVRLAATLGVLRPFAGLSTRAVARALPKSGR